MALVGASKAMLTEVAVVSIENVDNFEAAVAGDESRHPPCVCVVRPTPPDEGSKGARERKRDHD